MSTPSMPAAPLDPARAAESRAYQQTITLIVGPTVSLVLVSLRIYTRLAILRMRFWEDVAIVISMICAIAMSVLGQLAVVYGSGRHIETISPEDWAKFLKLTLPVAQSYSLCHFFLKLSILLQFHRLSVMPVDRRLCRTLLALLCIGYGVFIVLRMVRCIPIQAQWTPKLPGARCYFNTTWFFFASQTWNMVMDVVVLVVPAFILRHSRAPLLHKVLIGVVLAFGASACIVSALRLQTLHPSTTSKDPSWDKVPSAIYGFIEVNVGISCASIVTLRPLYRKLRVAISGNDKTAEDSLYNIAEAVARPRLRRDSLDFITGDTTQVGSNLDGEAERGQGMGRGRSSTSSATGKSLTQSKTAASDEDMQGPESKREKGV